MNEIYAAWERESERARAERANRRMFVLCVILIIALAASWAGFIWYESKFETVTQTQVEQQADGEANIQYVGGDYYGGAAKGDDND